MKISRFLLCLFALGVVLSGICKPSSADREELSLNGEWETITTKKLLYPDAADGWKAVEIPSLRTGRAVGGSEFSWYRRQIRIPPEWNGQRIFIHLTGARYHPRIYLDGRLIAERIEGWTPFEIEITDQIENGRSHLLNVCCQDWSATFVEGYSIPADATGDLRRVPKGKVIAPIGGLFTLCGIWDDVSLLAKPKQFLDDVAIVTSVRKMTISVSGRISGDMDECWVEGQVMEGDVSVLNLPPIQVDSEGRWKLAASFPEARFWSPEDPHLYWLKLTLLEDRGDKPVDVYHERFGFRELWAEGADFYFNGVKRHLLASSGWPYPGNQPDQAVRESLLKMKAGNNIAFRLHTQPWQKKWLRIADEVGMMIIEEGALWCDGSGGYAYSDQRFWDNTREHLAGMIRRDRNHASLVMWSLENEILHCGAARYYEQAEDRLAELGVFVKELDPSHLITYESDHDPGGVADVIGLHYPHEIPQHTDYPNTASWLEQTVKTGTGGDLLGSRGEDFHWDRKKPLYIGEFLWVPYQDYSPGTVFFGDEAYIDRSGYRIKAKAKAWMFQIIAYRKAGVSGMCPWTFAGRGGTFSTDSILYQTQKEAYEPIAIFPDDYDTRFFSGETISRDYSVFNDSVESQQLTLHWKLGDVGGQRDLQLSPAEYKPVSFNIQLPEVNERHEMEIEAALVSGGVEIHRAVQRISVFPRQKMWKPEGVELLIYDPDGGWCGNIGDLEFKRLSTLSEVEEFDAERSILVIAPNTLKKIRDTGSVIVGVRDSKGLLLQNYLNNAGKAIILEQYSLDEISPGVSLADHPSTMTFSTGGEHPILAGLQDEDLKFWRGDHYVSRREIMRPTRNGARTILVSGGEKSLAQGSIVELSSGRGTLILCQAFVGEKILTEPSAGVIFKNMLLYLADNLDQNKTVLITEDDVFDQKLTDLGVDFSRDISGAELLILHGGGELIESSAEAIGNFLNESGGRTLYWHSPEPEAFDSLRDILGIEVFEIVPCEGSLTIEKINNQVFTGICREDVTYVGKPVGSRAWYRQFEPDPTIIDRCLSPISSPSEFRRLEIEDMELDGTYVSVSGSGKEVIFATIGSATGKMQMKEPGYYRITVLAGGSPADEVYPRFEISINGETTNSVSLTQRDMKSYPVLAELPAGEVKIVLRFVNDVQTATEDRNLLVDAIMIDEKPIPDSELQILTLPPAVGVKDIDGNQLVIDCVRWDTRDLVRGNRYASALLANLGASFNHLEAGISWIPLSAIEPVGTIPYFSVDDREVKLVAAGTVTAEFECATDGQYSVMINGRSTPAQGIYAIASVSVDGEHMGEVEIKSRNGKNFNVSAVNLSAGNHRIDVEYANDLYRPNEDRNLYIGGIGFRLEQ